MLHLRKKEILSKLQLKLERSWDENNLVSHHLIVDKQREVWGHSLGTAAPQRIARSELPAGHRLAFTLRARPLTPLRDPYPEG